MIEMRWLVKRQGLKIISKSLQYNEYECDEEGRESGYGWQDVPVVFEDVEPITLLPE